MDSAADHSGMVKVDIVQTLSKLHISETHFLLEKVTLTPCMIPFPAYRPLLAPFGNCFNKENAHPSSTMLLNDFQFFFVVVYLDACDFNISFL